MVRAVSKGYSARIDTTEPVYIKFLCTLKYLVCENENRFHAYKYMCLCDA